MITELVRTVEELPAEVVGRRRRLGRNSRNMLLSSLRAVDLIPPARGRP